MSNVLKWKPKDIAATAFVMALYILLTVSLSPISFLGFQFRISEILILLCFYNKRYNWALIFGCAISNIFSPLGLVDVGFGTLSTLLSVHILNKFSNPFIGSILTALINGLLIGLALSVFYKIPFIIQFIQVFVGELVVLCVVGCPLFIATTKNKRFLSLIEK